MVEGWSSSPQICVKSRVSGWIRGASKRRQKDTYSTSYLRGVPSWQQLIDERLRDEWCFRFSDFCGEPGDPTGLHLDALTTRGRVGSCEINVALIQVKRVQLGGRGERNAVAGNSASGARGVLHGQSSRTTIFAWTVWREICRWWWRTITTTSRRKSAARRASSSSRT